MSDAADYGQLEFKVRRSTLAKLAEQAASVIPTGHLTQEVYGCIQVTVGPGLLQLAGTNMERTVWAETPSVAAEDAGRFYVSAKFLRAVLAEAADGDVKMAVSGARVTATAAGASWTRKLPPSRNYPALLDLAGVEFGQVARKDLLGALGTVRHAVGKDTGRPQYAQVSIAATGGPSGAVTASAWDSSQFARAPVRSFPFACGIPATGLDDLWKLLTASPDDYAGAGQTDPEPGRGALVFRVGPVTLAMLKIGKAFPNSDKLILGPALANELEFTADRTELQQAIRRVRISADPETSAIGLELTRARYAGDTGRLTLTARDKDDNTATEPVAASWAGEPRRFVVNGRMLYDMLDAHPSAACVLRIGADAGGQRSYLLLADEEAGVYGVIQQMQPSVVGY